MICTLVKILNKFSMMDLLFRCRWSREKIYKLAKAIFSKLLWFNFVIDCSDIYRIDEARDILHDTLEQKEFGETLLLVFANKIDTGKGFSIDELENKLKLKFQGDIEYHIQEINAINEMVYMMDLIGLMSKSIKKVS